MNPVTDTALKALAIRHATRGVLRAAWPLTPPSRPAADPYVYRDTCPIRQRANVGGYVCAFIYLIICILGYSALLGY